MHLTVRRCSLLDSGFVPVDLQAHVLNNVRVWYGMVYACFVCSDGDCKTAVKMLASLSMKHLAGVKDTSYI